LILKTLGRVNVVELRHRALLHYSAQLGSCSVEPRCPSESLVTRNAVGDTRAYDDRDDTHHGEGSIHEEQRADHCHQRNPS
jgi:hypothetical protein